MQNKTKLFTGLAAVTILVGGAIAVPKTSAAESITTSSPLSSLVEKIASKFNLNKEEVQAVFEEDRTAREANMQAKRKECLDTRLTEAVKDGELTQAQKDLITTKLTEVQAKQLEISKITDTGDRQAAQAQLKTDLAKWAADNDIDNRWLWFGEHGKPGMGRGPEFSGRWMRGDFSQDSSEAANLN